MIHEPILHFNPFIYLETGRVFIKNLKL